MSTHQVFCVITARIVCLSLLLIVLLGCQDKSLSDLQAFVGSAYQDRRPEIPALPEIKPYQSFKYASAAELDPFSVQNIVTDHIDGTNELGIRPDMNRDREPLEHYPLDALKVVGIVVQNRRPWGLVKTPEGIVHRTTIGNYIGQNDGKIKSILPVPKTVVLVELIADSSGHWQTREANIKMDE